MIGTAYVGRMALYNRWQNANLYGAADRLADEERRRERGAFFGSIHKTLSHVLWADRLWLSRFRGTPRPEGGIPESVALVADWQTLKHRRVEFDAEILRWADGLTSDWLAGELSYYSTSYRREIVGPRWMYIAHFLNHQTHHRGQVHCLLTQAGAPPAEDTDLSMMPAQADVYTFSAV